MLLLLFFSLLLRKDVVKSFSLQMKSKNHVPQINLCGWIFVMAATVEMIRGCTDEQVNFDEFLNCGWLIKESLGWWKVATIKFFTFLLIADDLRIYHRNNSKKKKLILTIGILILDENIWFGYNLKRLLTRIWKFCKTTRLHS